MACKNCNRKNKGTKFNKAGKMRPTVKITPDLVVFPELIKRRDTNKAPQKLILKDSLSPGDILMLTATVRDLHHCHPNKFITDVKTTCDEIWENNPLITPLDEKDPDVKVLKMEYPLIHRSNTSPYHFIHGYAMFLEDELDIRIRLTDFKGDIYVSDEEKSWISQVEEMDVKDDFWIIVSGGKYDFSAKWVNPDVMQEVVDHFKGKITFVQTGQKEHWHPKLKNVVDLIGKTSLREFIRLIYHSVGVLCPITFAMHAAAAVPIKKDGLKNRPCVVLAGGREPAQWEEYPHHRFLSTNGALKCCDNGGCWVSRCQKVNDGDEKDTKNICLEPVKVRENLEIPHCLDMIKSKHIIEAIEMYYEGGVLKYNKSTSDIDNTISPSNNIILP